MTNKMGIKDFFKGIGQKLKDFGQNVKSIFTKGKDNNGSYGRINKPELRTSVEPIRKVNLDDWIRRHKELNAPKPLLPGELIKRVNEGQKLIEQVKSSKNMNTISQGTPGDGKVYPKSANEIPKPPT